MLDLTGGRAVAGVVVRLLFLSGDGPATARDGQWLLEYDPGRTGEVDDGPVTAHLVCVPDPAAARRFASQAHAFSYLQQSCRRRPDGHPDRPITAYHLATFPIADDGTVAGTELTDAMLARRP